MIVSVRFISYAGDWQKLTGEQWAELRSHFPQLPEVRPEHATYETHLTDEQGIRCCARLGLSVDLASAADDTMLVKLQDRIAALEQRPKNDLDVAAAGAMVQIHIPDLGLLYLNEVTNLDNCCTDELRKYLDDGWKLLAVCPPNAQRRPDYILGRRKVK